MYGSFISCGLMLWLKGHLIFAVLLGREGKALGTHGLERSRRLTSDPGFTNVC